MILLVNVLVITLVAQMGCYACGFYDVVQFRLVHSVVICMGFK